MICFFVSSVSKVRNCFKSFAVLELFLDIFVNEVFCEFPLQKIETKISIPNLSFKQHKPLIYSFEIIDLNLASKFTVCGLFGGVKLFAFASNTEKLMAAAASSTAISPCGRKKMPKNP